MGLVVDAGLLPSCSSPNYQEPGGWVRPLTESDAKTATQARKGPSMEAPLLRHLPVLKKVTILLI